MFPSAYVDAAWGSTGTVHCIRPEHIPSYFLGHKPSSPLTAKQIEKMSRAFLALARMDDGFDRSVAERPGRAAATGSKPDDADGHV